MFKVGDKVVGNDNHTFDHRKGCLGVILGEEHGGFWVTWENDGETHWSEESEIDIVEDTEEEKSVITYKPGDKINWKWKDEEWGYKPEWQERVYTINEHMTRAYRDGGGFINLWRHKDTDYRLVEPAKEETKMTKFKVGDRVVSVNNSYSFCGKQGVITKIDQGGSPLHYVVIDNTGDWYEYPHYMDQLELVEEEQMKDKTWGEMSPEEKGALLLAEHEGKTIECYQTFNKSWHIIRYPQWDDTCKYRVKPEPIVEERESFLNYNTECKAFFWGLSDDADWKVKFNIVDGVLDESSVTISKV